MLRTKKFFNLVNLLDKKNVIFEPEKVKRTDYVEEREIIQRFIVLMLLFDYFMLM